jgi:hypothetical protein
MEHDEPAFRLSLGPATNWLASPPPCFGAGHVRPPPETFKAQLSSLFPSYYFIAYASSLLLSLRTWSSVIHFNFSILDLTVNRSLTMRSTLAFLALAASAAAQGVTNIIVPSSVPPAGCENSRAGAFAITIVNVTSPSAPASPVPSSSLTARNVMPRQAAGTLMITLDGGVMHDQANRTGYIASNYQFQFDAPPQAGAIYTGGFSVCQNGSLAIGGSAVFYQCLSGTFYNLYDRNWAEHCNGVYIIAIGGNAGAFSTAPPGPVSTGPDQATIANGGGTQSMNSTGVGIGGPTSTGKGSGIGSATATKTGGGASGSESGGQSAAATSSSSGGGALPTAVSRAQTLLGWAAGLVGAIAVVG